MKSLNAVAPLLAILYAVSLVAVTRGTHPAVIFLGAMGLAHMFLIALVALRSAQTLLLAIAATVGVKPETIRTVNEMDSE